MPLTSEQLQRLLDEPIYSWDVCNLLSGTVDFLAFSESNLVWQRRRELQRARERANALEFEPEDGHLLPQAREQIIESAELRFDIGLSQSVRYAGLISFVTAVEWCMCLFAKRLSSPLPVKPKGESEVVHTLNHLNGKVMYRLTGEVQILREIVIIRNCIVHAAGVIWSNGFRVFDDPILGEMVHVDEHAVDALAHEALIWVPALDRECSTNGTFTK
ncbi:hypothetical protein [Paraburkholderia fungorum]|uniref:Uncharacterized protein n=2 Tax=Paraburkholderia fungorum TaxID=134537 RepID=A0AAP5UYR2_9BURK|nr:hypothetical protein [Paraburkholderia fungorum]MDT8843673.1 hypothetical protein [Paraburkholderia fungorum]PZR45665.1 MAG: hypothetical protein DI523_20265 [Paraburkholderia fungorum]